MPLLSPDTQIIVLLKAPRPGFAKTRLAAAIGEAEALQAYNRLVSHLVERIARMTHIQLRFAPDGAEAEIAHWLKPCWIARPQGDGDLGQRMLSAFASSEADGFSKTIIIGSDCPYLETSDLEEAEFALDANDLVIGPANDGGYWLIGLKESRPELFTHVDWGTERVLTQTLSVARQLNFKHHLLRTLSDVDSQEDWNAFQAASIKQRY